LEAKVVLQVPGDYRELLNRYLPLLPAYFIVSQAELTADSLAAEESVQVPGLKVQVVAAEGSKCERCWNYATSVGDHAEHPSLCSRCVAALAAG
jgi:isoleucyl-tRNA synthetase